MGKPFMIKNRTHMSKVLERIERDLRALAVWEFENVEPQLFEGTVKAYKNIFDDDPIEIHYKEKREYLDSINKKRYEKEMFELYGEDWKEQAGEYKTDEQWFNEIKGR